MACHSPAIASKTFCKNPRFPSGCRCTPFSMSGRRWRLAVAATSSLLSVDAGRREDVLASVRAALSCCLTETHLELTVPDLKAKSRGKVRDIYEARDYMVLVTTDRQSAFDRVLASIPFKGQVLNETSMWWFSKTEHLVPNAMVCSPDKNVTVVKKCSVFPVEFVGKTSFLLHTNMVVEFHPGKKKCWFGGRGARF